MDTTLLDLLKRHGATAAIALFLIWFMANVVVARLDAIAEAQGQMRVEQAVDRQLLRGICYGVNPAGPGRTWCEAGK